MCWHRTGTRSHGHQQHPHRIKINTIWRRNEVFITLLSSLKEQQNKRRFYSVVMANKQFLLGAVGGLCNCIIERLGLRTPCVCVLCSGFWLRHMHVEKCWAGSTQFFSSVSCYSFFKLQGQLGVKNRGLEVKVWKLACKMHWCEMIKKKDMHQTNNQRKEIKIKLNVWEKK